jgi:glucokinase
MGASSTLIGQGWVVGLDIGGTLIKGVVVGPDGTVEERHREPTQAAHGPGAIVERAIALLERARSQLGVDRPLRGIGLAVPGFVDERRGVVQFAANLGWRDLEVSRIVGQRLGVPVCLGHDVRLGGMAEGALGAARDAKDFLFVPVGTGIAAALTLGGKQRKGPSGLAGEIGHVVVEPGGAPCRCGGRGCLEAMASASAIGRRYRERVPGTPVGAEEVLALLDQGDPEAGEVWSSALGYLAGALASVHGTVQLELIVVGGGLAKAGSRLLVQLEAAIAARLPCLPPPRVALATLGDEAAGLGAALMARAAGGA